MIRSAGAADVPFPEGTLFEAVHWRSGVRRPPPEKTLAEPQVARYVERWGRPGDAGLVAVDYELPVGAAWYRLFTAARPGYGFVDEATPELTVGVVVGERGRGVGTALLRALLDEARRAGFEAISLSVEPDNPAVRLYERAGFARVGGSGTSTMLAKL